MARSQEEEELCHLACASPWFSRALRAGRALALNSWCIGAGAVRNLVWDHLHGFAEPSALRDVDFAYYEPSDLSPESERLIHGRLHLLEPELPWEATNQARVHLWFASQFGHSVPPLGSLQEAVASWPEYATSVAVTVTAEGKMEVIAPYGLHDLFTMRVRRNPARVSAETYRQRVAEKRYTERWPRATVIAC